MADKASVSTNSTRGFTLFDELCRGVVKNYSYNLVDLRQKSTRERIDALIDKIDKTITDLELHSDKKPEQCQFLEGEGRKRALEQQNRRI